MLISGTRQNSFRLYYYVSMFIFRPHVYSCEKCCFRLHDYNFLQQAQLVAYALVKSCISVNHYVLLVRRHLKYVCFTKFTKFWGEVKNGPSRGISKNKKTFSIRWASPPDHPTKGSEVYEILRWGEKWPLPWDIQKTKKLSASGGLRPWPPDQRLCPGPRWGLPPERSPGSKFATTPLPSAQRQWRPDDRAYCADTIRYDTIGEFNVDSKAEYSALSSTRSQTTDVVVPSADDDWQSGDVRDWCVAVDQVLCSLVL